ncbi:MAG: hypothetical protein QM813_16915 [Verrucomicrobiota bacterium]
MQKGSLGRDRTKCVEMIQPVNVSSVWGSVRTPPAAAPNPIARWVKTAPQADPTQVQSQYWEPTPAAQGDIVLCVESGAQDDLTIRTPQFFRAATSQVAVSTQLGARVQSAPQVDLTQQSAIWESVTAGTTGLLGNFLLSVPQKDPTQIQPNIWPSAAAAPVVSYRPLSMVQTAPQPNPTQIAPQIWSSAAAAPAVSYNGLPFVLSAPQADPTQLQAKFWNAPTAQGVLGSYVYSIPQADPTQIQPNVWTTTLTPPITGFTVPQFQTPPQPDLNINYTVLWTPSTFSPSAPIPPDTSLPGGPWGNPAAGRGTMSETIGFREPEKKRKRIKLTPVEREIQLLINKLEPAKAVTLADALPKEQVEKLAAMESNLKQIQAKMEQARSDEEAIAILLMMIT